MWQPGEFPRAALGVIALSIAAAVAGELLQWLFIYRTALYKKVHATLSKGADKAGAAPAPGGGGGGGGDAAGSRAAKKREERLEALKADAGRHVAGFNFKSGAINAALLLVTIRLVPRLFGAGAVARLPFEPPAFLRKLTARGLAGGAGARECSAIFIYVLAQSSVRPLVQKVMGLGPGRLFASVQPKSPLAAGLEAAGAPASAKKVR